MNIIYHHRTQGTGAEGVHIAYIIKGLRGLGHEVRVVSPNDADPALTAGNNPFAKKSGVKAEALNLLSRFLPQFLFELLELGYNFAAAGKLKKVLAQGNVDFIYERNAFFLYAGAKLARKHRIPYIVEVNEISGEKRVRKQFFVGLAKRIERRVFEQADAIIVVSDFLKEKISSQGIPAAKIHVIPNAVDEREFDPGKVTGANVRRQFGFSTDAAVVGFIGWFVGWHNLELLIEVFADVAKGKKAYLFLVGDGVLQEKFQAMGKELGISGQLIFSGAVPYAKIPEYIAAMDVGVIPGSNEYRSPIKLFEYMAMAKPVLAPRLRPIERIVADGTDGVLFQPDDRPSLTAGLTRLIQNTPLRTALGQAARAKVVGHHTWSKNAQRVVEIYKNGTRY